MSAVLPTTKLTATTLDDFLESQPVIVGRDATFDLTHITFVSPGAIVPIAAVCHALHRAGHDVVVKLSDNSVRSYLMRMGFMSAVRGVVRFEPEVPRARSMMMEALRGTNPVLVEVTKIENGADLPDLLDQIVHVLRYRLKYKKYDAFDIATAISEICQNTFDHNTGTYGFIGMQMYQAGRKRFIEVAVADHGAGLRTTLQQNPKNPHIRTDSDAINVATQLGTSQYDDPTRGTGLHHLLKIAFKHEATVEIRSGSAKVRFRMDRKTGWHFPCRSMPGVQASISLHRK